MGASLLGVMVNFVPEDDHNKPIELERDGLSHDVVRYDLPNARGEPVFKVLDYRDSTLRGWRAMYGHDRLDPAKIREFLNGPANILFEYESVEEEDNGIVRRVKIMKPHAQLTEFSGEVPMTGVFTHVGHGQWIDGSAARYIKPNRQSDSTVPQFGRDEYHAAITVVSTLYEPAVIRQVRCYEQFATPPYVFMNDQLNEVNASLVAQPENAVQHTAQMLSFLQRGIIPA